MKADKSYRESLNPLVTMFPYPLHTSFKKPHPYKQNPYEMYLNITGAGFVVSSSYLFILNGFNLENWKSILGLIASAFFIVMWGIGKVKDMKHKSRMRKYQYTKEEIELKKLKEEEQKKKLDI